MDHPKHKVSKHWYAIKDGDSRGIALYERHYSCRAYKDGRKRRLFVGPGFKTVLITECHSALFVWRKFIDASGQKGINCAVFRNETNITASVLILDAMEVAWVRWPSERLYTYVNANSVRSSNPGCCFRKAGWKKCGKTKGGLLIFEAFQHKPAGFKGKHMNESKDISTEIRRTYRWPDGTTVSIENPTKLITSDGGHRIVDADNNGHYIPAGWCHLKWENKPGVVPVVA